MRLQPSEELLREAKRLSGPNGLVTRFDRERASLIGEAFRLRAATQGVNRSGARHDLSAAGLWRPR
jgi:hypothetical protein